MPNSESKPDTAGSILLRCGGPVDQTTVSLCIYGESLDPEEVTSILEIQPTSARSVGEVRVGKYGNSMPARTGAWILDAPDATGDLDAQVAWLIERLKINPAVLLELSRRFDVQLRIGLFLSEWNRGTSLSAASLEALASWGVRCEFGIYYTPDDQDPPLNEGELKD